MVKELLPFRNELELDCVLSKQMASVFENANAASGIDSLITESSSHLLLFPLRVHHPFQSP